QIPNYLAFFEIADHYLLATNNGLSYQQEVAKGILKNVKRILKNRYLTIDSLGGFRHVDSSRLAAILDTVSYDPQKQYSLNENRLSKYDITYLNKMVTFCKNNNIQVIFVRSPYHVMFDGHRYENIFQAYKKEHFPNIPFLDFQDFPMDDSEFKDLEHLNLKGARKFSLWFEKLSK
ncbi:MAG TPA: hypothetical protein DHV22_15955, partial [Xanthomarina gelatinilytica]|nr:hypothetical protein [Xanthomarina gelatinilytica]